MKNYFIHNGHSQEGPFDIEALKAKKITKDTPIWYEGIKDWTKAGMVEELKELFVVSTPPPFGAPPIFSNSEPQKKAVSNVTSQTSKHGQNLKSVFILISIIVVGLVGCFIYKQIQRGDVVAQREDDRVQQEQVKTDEIDRTDEIKADIRKNISTYVTAERSDYYYKEIGGISGLSITVKNGTNYSLDNVRVKVTYVKANGETWEEENLDFAYVSPNSQMTLKAPDSKRGTGVRYEIVSIKSTELGIN